MSMAMPNAAKSIPPDDFAVEPPDVSGIVTEDDTPVDNFASEKQQRLLTEPLYTSWQGPPPRAEGGADAAPRTFIAAANVGIFAHTKEPPLVPDAFLSLDVKHGDDLWKKENRTYFIWEMGKPPNVVVEVVSNREGGELGKKRQKYAEWGIHYYVVWDPQGMLGEPRLRAFALGGDDYQRMSHATFPRIGLSLVLWEGTYEGFHDVWLRWAKLDGTLIPTGAELVAEERKRLDEVRKSADEERKRADAAQARAERLAERLRSLGIDPNVDG